MWTTCANNQLYIESNISDKNQNVCKRPAITIQICNPLSTEIQCEIRVVLWQWPGFCQPVSYIRCCFINKSFPKKEKYSDVPKKKNIGISQLNRLKRRAFERAEEAKKEAKLQQEIAEQAKLDAVEAKCEAEKAKKEAEYILNQV